MKNRTLRWLSTALMLVALPAFGQLSGTYTIDASGSGTSNYTTFAAATTALSTSGVSGPVIFNVASGTYTEQVTIPAYTGTSTTNTVTFQANPSNTTAATVTYSPASSSTNWTIRLDGTSNVTIKGLVITTGGTSYGRLIDQYGANTNISLIDNTLTGATGTSSSSYFAGIYYTYSSTTEAKGNWTITGNTISNVSSAAYIYGKSYTTSMDTMVLDNNVISMTNYGIYIRYAKYQHVHGNTVNYVGTSTSYGNNYLYYPSVGVDVQNNDINNCRYGFYIYSNPPSGGTPASYVFENNDIEGSYYGIYMSGSGSSSYTQAGYVSIKKNNIVAGGTSTNYGIYIGYMNGSSTNRSVVENNMIALNSSSTSSSAYGMYLYHTGNVDVLHNSISVANASSTSGRALYMNKSTSTSYFTAAGNVFKNNIFTNTGGGYAAEASSAAVAGTYFTADYNVYNATGTSPFKYNNSTVATLAAWQTATSQDANSAFGDPLFSSATDLHAQGALADNAGTPVGTLTDIDGDSRSTTTPDIGADEYAALTCFGVSGLAAANVTAVGFDATWTSNNATTIGTQARHRLSGSTSAWTITSGTTNSISVSGLTAATAYDYAVREICAIGDTCVWSASASITPAQCAATSQCQYMVYMTDAYGDGWNGNSLVFSQGGNPVGTMGAGFTTGSAYTDSVMLCDVDSATVTLNLGSWSNEIGFDVVGPYGDTLISVASGTTYTNGHNFGSFLGYCSSCALVTSLPYSESFDGTSWSPSTTFDACWTPNPNSGGFRWNVSTGGTGSSGTGPSAASNGSNYLYLETSSGTAGASATVTGPNMTSGYSSLSISFDYHMYGATMGNLYLESNDGTGWVTFDSIVGQQQTSNAAAWLTGSSLLTTPAGVFSIRFRGTRGASYTGDMAIDNIVIASGAVCPTPNSLTASNIGMTSFDLAWSSTSSSSLSYEVRYRTNGSTGAYTSNGASATVSGLTATSSYDVSVREICAVADTGSWSSDLVVMTSLCAAADQCQYMVYMTDAYGDGWNGNKLIFSQSGVAVGTLGAGFATGSAFTDSISLCDMTSAAVTLDLGSWSSEIGFDVVGPYGDTVLTHTSGTTLTTGYSFGSFLAYCSSCQIVTSLPYTENFEDTASWTPSGFPYNSIFDACWTPSPDAVTTSVFRWVVGSGSTPSGSTGPAGASNFIYSEASYGTTGNIATVTMPNMQFTDSNLVFSFDYHMYGATMGNLYAEYDAGSGWVAFDSIVGQQQTGATDPWITRNTVLTNPMSVFTIRLRAEKGTSFTGDMAIDNVSIDALQSCGAPSGVSASNITNTSFDVAWTSYSLNTGSPLSYEVRYRLTGGSAYMSNGASASIAGLTSATSYDVSVREICAVGDTSGWSSDLAVTTAICAAVEQCGFIVYMTDSYGDGWQGNTLTFTQSGMVSVSNVGSGFALGASFTDTVMLCGMDSASVTLGNLGAWSDEVGFNVTDMNSGDTLLTHTSGTTLTAGQAFGTFFPECRTPATYTVSVNMAKETIHPAGVHIAGNFQGWNPSATLMTDPNGDGIYEYTINTYLDEHLEYKFINGGAWGSDENVPTDCRYNGSWNRGDSIANLADTAAVVCFAACTDCQINVTFQVNMAWEIANGSVSGDSIHVAGSMQGWAPAGTVMLDTAGNGIYQVTVAAPINSKIYYKYLNGKTWNDAEASGDLSACGEDDGFGGNNRVDSLGVTDTVLGVVCFTKCYDCSVGLPEAVTGVTLYPNPTRGEFTLERIELEGDIEVTVVDMQGQVLRATLWTTGQADLDMDLSDMASGVYMIRLNTDEGNRTMRVAIQR
ncbi:MAG: fibronectin type III domain-containing protein [Flavobacteriales bacterium]